MESVQAALLIPAMMAAIGWYCAGVRIMPKSAQVFTVPHRTRTALKSPLLYGIEQAISAFKALQDFRLQHGLDLRGERVYQR
jgi:hypothetical protein